MERQLDFERVLQKRARTLRKKLDKIKAKIKLQQQGEAELTEEEKQSISSRAQVEHSLQEVERLCKTVEEQKALIPEDEQAEVLPFEHQDFLVEFMHAFFFIKVSRSAADVAVQSKLASPAFQQFFAFASQIAPSEEPGTSFYETLLRSQQFSQIMQDEGYEMQQAREFLAQNRAWFRAQAYPQPQTTPVTSENCVQTMQLPGEEQEPSPIQTAPAAHVPIYYAAPQVPQPEVQQPEQDTWNAPIYEQWEEPNPATAWQEQQDPQQPDWADEGWDSPEVKREVAQEQFPLQGFAEKKPGKVEMDEDGFIIVKKELKRGSLNRRSRQQRRGRR